MENINNPWEKYKFEEEDTSNDTPNTEDSINTLNWETDNISETDNNNTLNTEDSVNASDWRTDNTSEIDLETENDFDNFSTELENPDEENNTFDVNTPENFEKKYSFLGAVTRIKVDTLQYKFDYDNEKATAETHNSPLTPLDQDGKFKLNLNENTPFLNNIISGIKEIAFDMGLNINHAYFYKNFPKESTINVSRTNNSRFDFIYFLRADKDKGNLILDLSSINGPSVQAFQSSAGILVLIPSWVSYSITRNKSTDDFIAIGGKLS